MRRISHSIWLRVLGFIWLFTASVLIAAGTGLGVLGVGGHLLELKRRRVGPLHIEQSCTIEEIVTAGRLGRISHQLLTLDEALAHVPVLMVSQEAAERARHGVPIPFHAVGCADVGGALRRSGYRR